MIEFKAVISHFLLSSFFGSVHFREDTLRSWTLEAPKSVLHLIVFSYFLFDPLDFLFRYERLSVYFHLLRGHLRLQLPFNYLGVSSEFRSFPAVLVHKCTEYRMR